MGTRGLLGFKINGGYIGIAFTWDANHSNLGNYIVDFLRSLNEYTLDDFRKKVERLITPMRDYVPRASFYVGDGVCEPYNINKNRQIEDMDILREIINGNLTHIYNEINFIKDSVYCEYGYIINLDDNLLECYIGGEYQCSKFQKENPFSYDKIKQAIEGSNMSWFPCRFIAKFNLLNIPEKWSKVFSLGYNRKPRGREYYLNKNEV